jgi:hypothetical protein
MPWNSSGYPKKSAITIASLFDTFYIQKALNIGIFKNVLFVIAVLRLGKLYISFLYV